MQRIILLTALVLAVTACSSDTDPAADPTTAPDVGTTTSVAPTTAPDPATPTPAPSTGTPSDDAAGDGQSSTASIDIVDFDYEPPQTTVTAGTELTWTNTGVAAHTVTIDEGDTFASGEIAPDATFSTTLDQPGTYSYHCEFHPQMTGTIIVE